MKSPKIELVKALGRPVRLHGSPARQITGRGSSRSARSYPRRSPRREEMRLTGVAWNDSQPAHASDRGSAWARSCTAAATSRTVELKRRADRDGRPGPVHAHARREDRAGACPARPSRMTRHSSSRISHSSLAGLRTGTPPRDSPMLPPTGQQKTPGGASNARNVVSAACERVDGLSPAVCRRLTDDRREQRRQ